MEKCESMELVSGRAISTILFTKDICSHTCLPISVAIYMWKSSTVDNIRFKLT